MSTCPINDDGWKQLWMRRIFKTWHGDPPRQLCVVVFCGGQCGGEWLHSEIRKKCPCFLFHNIREFHQKFSRFSTHSPLSFAQKRAQERLAGVTAHDIFAWVASIFREVIVLDVFRCPIERALLSFLHYPGEALRKSRLNQADWMASTDAERAMIFENRIFHHVEQRHGLDTEYTDENGPSAFIAGTAFDASEQCWTARHHAVDNLRFFKLRWQDRREWTTVLNRRQCFPFFLQEPPADVWRDRCQGKGGMWAREFVVQYQPSLPFLAMVLQLPICRRYVTISERVCTVQARLAGDTTLDVSENLFIHVSHLEKIRHVPITTTGADEPGQASS